MPIRDGLIRLRHSHDRVIPADLISTIIEGNIVVGARLAAQIILFVATRCCSLLSSLLRLAISLAAAASCIDHLVDVIEFASSSLDLCSKEANFVSGLSLNSNG